MIYATWTKEIQTVYWYPCLSKTIFSLIRYDYYFSNAFLQIANTYKKRHYFQQCEIKMNNIK